MKASRFVAKNTVLLTLGLFAGRVMALFVFRKLAGEVAAAGTGVWGTAIDITSMVLVAANFGLGPLITREIIKAREMTLAVFWSALRLRLLIGVAGYFAVIGYVFVTGFDSPTRAAVLAMALGVVLETTGMACDSVLQAHEKVQYQTYSQILSAVVYFALGWWWLEAGYGLMGVVWANVLSRVSRLALLAPLMLLGTGPWRRGGAGPGMKAMAAMGLPLFLSTTFGIISYKVDTVMLMEMVGKTAAGIYTMGHKALDVMLIAPNLFATAMFPSLMRYGAKAIEAGAGAGASADVERMGERALRYLQLGLLPLAMLCVVASGPVIRWFSTDPEFAPSIIVFQIVIWGLPLQGANLIYNRILLTLGRESCFVRIALASMITNVGLNLLLIPRFRWYGAAATTITSLAVGVLMHRRYIAAAGMRVPWRRGVIGGTASLAVAWLIVAGALRIFRPEWGGGWLALPDQAGWTPAILAIGATAVLYPACLLLLRVLRREDLELLLAVRRG